MRRTCRFYSVSLCVHSVLVSSQRMGGGLGEVFISSKWEGNHVSNKPGVACGCYSRFRRLSWEGLELEASLGHRARPCLKQSHNQTKANGPRLRSENSHNGTAPKGMQGLVALPERCRQQWCLPLVHLRRIRLSGGRTGRGPLGMDQEWIWSSLRFCIS